MKEIAERKAYLLNDNGQVDFFLRSGGGPLEIQYLNMLSAHSSYWLSRDFIRMLCVEDAYLDCTLDAMNEGKKQRLRGPVAMSLIPDAIAKMISVKWMSSVISGA
ncbi:phospholipase like protein [Verticillium longisporum]|uniref:Phospholipase like protein n=1 Tax=Verticillium longisporum TaxID=100787 RepID=A0A8I2ZJX9_VERLO|nr:phospholipase like protein [Verticillium longisporum]